MSLRASAGSREPRAVRRSGLVIGLVVVMAASAAGLWTVWRGISHQGGGAVPLIHADQGPVKVAPANPGGMTVPDQNIAILNRKGTGDTRVEQLLPPPETPLPRPALAEPQVAAMPPVAVPAASPQAGSPPVATPVANAATAIVVPPPPSPAPAPTANPAALSPSPARGYRLQVGAVRSEEAAQQEWARLKRVHGGILGKFDMRVARTDLPGRGVFFRIEAGPIADGTAAQRACDALKQQKVGCILVRP